MKKLLLLFILMTFSLGQSQGLSQGFESGGINGAPFASGALPTVTREAGPGTNTTQVVKFVGNTGSALWQGVNLSLTTNLNLTAATTRTMSIDVYASGPLFFLVKVNGGIAGAPEAAAVVEYTGTNTWQTCSFTFNSVRDGKAIAANGTYAGFVLHAYWPSAVATTFPAGNATARTLYVDNITGPLALTSATVGAFTVPSKLVGAATFTITPPTSNNTSPFTYTSNNTAVGTIVSGNQIQVGSIGSATITAAQVSDGTYAATSTTATFNVVPAAAPTPPVRAAIDVVSVFSGAYTVGVTSPTFGASTAVDAGGTDAARLYTSSNNGVISFTSTTAAAGMTHLHMDIFSTTAQAAGVLIQINGVNSSSRSTPNGVWTSLDIPSSAWAAGFGASLTGIGILPNAGSGTFYVDNVYFYRLPLLTGNMYINDGTFAAGDFCTAAGQDIDTNDGTAAKPFATLAYALARSSKAAGVVFYVDAGTYSWSATHTFTASGTVGNPITIQGKGSTTNITSTTSTNSGLYFTTGSNWVVKDLSWTATNARSVWVDTATGISLENCTFSFTSASTSLQSIIIGNAAGKLTIKNCTLTRSNTTFHMIEIVAGTSLTLQDNTIRFPAMAAVGTASSVHVASNAASVLIMERNKLYGGGYGVGFTTGTSFAANANTIIKNNFFSTNWGIVNTQLTGLKVYNNSFYTANNCLYGITPAFMNNWDIQNNILYTYGAAACVLVNATTAATMNYNHYYYPNAGAGAGAVNLSGTTSTLAAWKASGNPLAIREANGQGGAVTANNPLYTNIASLATTDLHIESASPTIGVGSNVGVTDDIDGNARPLGGTYDLGADESVPGTPAITNFPAIAKVMGDAPFNVTQPTSNSTGAWTYSITVGNNTVATISGTTVTLVAPGTATIRATQAADGTYIEGFIEATLTVTPSPFPLTGAPGEPGKNSWDVISLFSSDYTDLAGTNFNPNWGQAVSTANGSLVFPNNMTTPSYGSNAVKQYQNSGNYQGTALAASTNISAMTRFHIEIYSTTLTSIRVSLIKTSGGTVEVPTTLALTPNQWNVFNIDISGAPFSAVRPVFLEIKYDSPAGAGNIQNLIVDNLFFWRPATAQPPTIGTFTVPAKAIGDAAFTLTAPTSNSAGAFTYTSSNTAVATISGSTVTVVGAGSSTITATQVADGSYGAGSTTATLSVTPPAAPTPIARNAWDVISLYSNAYTTSSSASWGVGTDVSISGDNTRLLSGSATYRLPFTATNVSAMTTLHIDVYALNQASWQFRLNDKAVTKSTPVNGWTSIDILLSEYAPQSLNLTNVSYFDFFNPNGANPNTSYVDNIYFYRAATTVPPTFGAFTVATKDVSDAAFAITPPTTNSAGAITYTSSNQSVATISGSTITIVGMGTSTITASQAADGSYGAGTTTATFTVTGPTTPVAGPTVPPARNAWDVRSQYSTAYTNQAGVIFSNFGSAAVITDQTLADNSVVKKYATHTFSGIAPNGANNLNVSAMTHLHIDVWSPDFTSFKIKLEATNGSNNEIEVPFSKIRGTWNSYDIALSTYTATNLANLKWIVPVTNGNANLFITNVYFYRPATTEPPTLGTFTVPTKLLGAAPFTLTKPTSNSTGAFTYTSSNLSVATISGSTVTIVGAGTSTITATQAASTPYSAGTTTAVLSVTPLAAPTPVARNAWDVISLYSNAYTTSSSASWGGVGTDVSISGNNTRLLSGSPTYRLPFTATNVSEMTTLHIDVYALNQASWQFRLNDKAVVVGTPINGWTSVDILLSAYAPQSVDLTNVSFFDFFNPLGANPNTSYVDNIYFYRAATPRTQIRPMQCGKTLSYLTSAIQASPLVGATEYTFEVTRTDNNAVNTIVTSNYYFFPATLITDGLVYGKSYSIKVKAKIGGTYTPYGNTCIVTAPTEPVVTTTKVRPMQCGKTMNFITDAIQASPVYLATQYEFEVTSDAGTFIAPSNNYYFSLFYSVPGRALYSTPYSIRVRSKGAATAFTAWGATCIVTTPAAPMARMSDTNEIESIFNVKGFPNPFASHFSLDIESSSDAQVEMTVYDMIGRQLEVRKTTVSELSVLEVGHNYPAGVYNVLVSQGDKVKSIRMIKR